jgi:fermentation-respiration switch protein FrsA (DUF1100 family)
LRPLRLLTALAVVVLAAYAGAVGYLFAFQRHYVFKPGHDVRLPQSVGLAEAEPLALTMADGTELRGWYRKPSAGAPTLLYFHGNAGSVADRADRFRQVLSSGFGLLAMNYRGYGDSGGSPSEAALVSDGVALFDWLAQRDGPIVIYGESLGTAVAVAVAAQRKGSALILEAPFTAALDIAAATYPWVPVSLLMRDPFLSRERIREVEEPLLVVHGTADQVVPVALGRKLFDRAGEPKRLVIVEGGAHNDLWSRGLWPAVLDFLKSEKVLP